MAPDSDWAGRGGADAAGWVVLTGASSGIGAAILARLQQAGRHVLAVARREVPQATAWVGADLSERRGQLDAVSAVRERLGTHAVASVVHAAGVMNARRLGRLDPDGFRRMWEVNVAAAAALVDGLCDRLADDGRVVLIGSRTMGGKAGRSEYAATKAALPALARSWASELAPRRITVNVVAPGPTDTPMLSDPRRSHEPVARTPLGRPVHPDEVAALVEYLLGPHAAMITGQTITICAGASLP